MSTNYDEKSGRNRSAASANSTQPLLGIYQAEVTLTADAKLNGRVRVHIPALQKFDGATDGNFTVNWSSPFAGMTKTYSGSDEKNAKDTGRSYGMWMVPPDPGNMVLVAFANGNPAQGYIISTIFPSTRNSSVPGNAAAVTHADKEGLLAALERNLNDTKKTPGSPRAVDVELSETLTKQGTINDPFLGAGRASARRESPSQVFGISTPGPRDPADPESRLSGHSFVMDDHLDSRMIRLRTARGLQITMNDTDDSITVINSSGTGYLRIDQHGVLNVYSASDINFRSVGNFNIRSDRDINIESGGNIKIKATGDVDPKSGAYKGQDMLGQYGHIQLEAAANMTQYAAWNWNATTVAGDMTILAGQQLGMASLKGSVGIKSLLGGISLDSTLPTTLFSAAGIHLTGGLPIIANAPAIFLNSSVPSLATPIPLPPLVNNLEIGTNTVGSLQPAEFDAEAATKGEGNALPTGGERPTEPIPRKTIVSSMPGPLPYSNMVQYNAKQDNGEVSNNEGVTENLPEGSSSKLGIPDDVTAPNGTYAGAGRATEDGSSVGGMLNNFVKKVGAVADQVSSFSQSAADEFSSMLSSATGSTGTNEGSYNPTERAAQGQGQTTETVGGENLQEFADNFSGAVGKVQATAQQICALPGQVAGMIAGAVEAELQKIADKIADKLLGEISGAFGKINALIGMAGGNRLVTPGGIGALMKLIQAIIQLSQLEFPCSLKDMKNALTQGLVQGITGAVTNVVGNTVGRITGELSGQLTNTLGLAKNAVVGKLLDAIPGNNLLSDIVESGIGMVADRVENQLNQKVLGSLYNVSGDLMQQVRESVPTYAEIMGDVDNNFRYANEKRLFDTERDLVPLESLVSAIPPLSKPETLMNGKTIIGSGYPLSEQELAYKFVAISPEGYPLSLDDPQVEDMRLQIADSVSNSKTQAELEAFLGYYGITARNDSIYQGDGENGYIFQNQDGMIFVDFTRGLGSTGAVMLMSAQLVQIWNSIKSGILVKINDNQAMSLASFALSIGPEQFLQSNVLDALNRGQYNEISRLMQGWVNIKRQYHTTPVITPQLRSRRHYEGQLFQTPDGVIITSNPNNKPGQTTFDQLAFKVKARRQEYLYTLAATGGYEIKVYPCCDDC